MKLKLLAVASAGFVAIANAFFEPMTVFRASVAVGVGVVAHELVHYIAAITVGASDVRFVWAGRPEVRYKATPAQIRAVNIAPTVIGGLLLLFTLINPVATRPMLFVDVMFCIGLIGFSRADWSLRHATSPA